MLTRKRNIIFFTVATACAIALAVLCLLTGSVDIPPSEVANILCGNEASRATWQSIILEIRIPSIITAALAGAALSVAGLMMQTVFNNPLAGPSILGVSTGASLGVAIAVLALGASAQRSGMTLFAAIAGAAAVTLALVTLSALVRSTMMLLIVGILLSYLTSSIISLLNFFGTEQGVHSYVMWGLGSFSTVGTDSIGIMSTVSIIAIVLATICAKPLNAMLAGDRYAANLGLNVRTWRTLLLLIAAALTAVVTAYCGPIAFVGLVVPHIARLLLNTANHNTLLPATTIAGIVTGLLTLYLSTAFSAHGILPVNAITPIIGVPIILYIIFNRRRISYFN
jgi:iron complex transport system permease protein